MRKRCVCTYLRLYFSLFRSSHKCVRKKIKRQKISLSRGKRCLCHSILSMGNGISHDWHQQRWSLWSEASDVLQRWKNQSVFLSKSVEWMVYFLTYKTITCCHLMAQHCNPHWSHGKISTTNYTQTVQSMQRHAEWYNRWKVPVLIPVIYQNS